MGRWGSLPPHPVWFESAELGVAQLSARATFSIPLGAARSGVLAIRVWKAPYVFFAAEAIAAAAQAHGQEDDITALTLTFAGAATVDV